MRLAIMQPYFLPYLGYFQLMNLVDEFVVYDNIKYTKKGWINRNRILVNGNAVFITVPLKHESDELDVGERHLADTWDQEKMKMLNRIISAYQAAPYFSSVFPVIKKIILCEERNLFGFLYHSINEIKEYLGIKTPLVVSSSIQGHRDKKKEEKVLAICKTRKASVYLNPIGGLDLYDPHQFKENGVELCFMKMKDFEYKQFSNAYVPFLSILDVMMFNSVDQIRDYLHSQYELIKPSEGNALYV